MYHDITCVRTCKKTGSENWTSVDSAMSHYVWFCSWMGPYLFSSLIHSNLCYGFFEQFWPSLQRLLSFLELTRSETVYNCFKVLIYKLGQTPFKERSWLHGIFWWSNIQIPVDIWNFFINEMSRPDSVSSIG